MGTDYKKTARRKNNNIVNRRKLLALILAKVNVEILVMRPTTILSTKLLRTSVWKKMYYCASILSHLSPAVTSLISSFTIPLKSLMMSSWQTMMAALLCSKAKYIFGELKVSV